MTRRIARALPFVAACGGTVSGGPDGSTDATAPTDGSQDVSADALADGSKDAQAIDGGAADAAPGTYTAVGWSGGLDHLTIYKADPQRKLCFQVALASPMTNNSNVTLPPQWGLGVAMAVHDDLACSPPYTGDAGYAISTGQSGSIDWPDSGFLIPTVVTSVDVTLEFDGGPSWVPASELLGATNVPVQ